MSATPKSVKVVGVQKRVGHYGFNLTLACGHVRRVDLGRPPKKYRCYECERENTQPETNASASLDLLFSKARQTARPLDDGRSSEAQLRSKAKQQKERSVKARVRAIVFKRDGGCRVPDDPRYPHGGTDQWAHLEEGRRTKTTGRDPEERHTPRLSCRLCDRHHDMYDGQAQPRMSLRFASDDQADGHIEWYVEGELVGGTD